MFRWVPVFAALRPYSERANSAFFKAIVIPHLA
jgi:hypothetical protein